VRRYFEPRFGQNFGSVRIHQDREAAESAESLGARAYTVGRAIVFGAGEYQPRTAAGRRLLAHELAHVVQQSRGGESIQRQAIPDCSNADRQAMWSESIARARSMNQLAKTLLPDKRRRAQNTSILGKYGLYGRAEGEHLTMSAIMGQRNAESYVAYYTRAQAYLEGELKWNCEAATGAQDQPIRFDGEFHVRPAWFNLAAEASGQTSRVGTLLRAVYTYVAEREFREKSTDPRDAAWIPTVVDLWAGVANELGEMGSQGGITFDDALVEAMTVLHVGFGRTAGSALGVDPSDAFDARDFREDPTRRGVIVATTEPWVAISNMVKNARSPVPSAGGGETFWSFDCFEFVTLSRIYAYFRTMPRAEFNERFNPLTIGATVVQAGVEPTEKRGGLRWDEPIKASKPGEAPYRDKPMEHTESGGQLNFEIKKVPVGQSWAALLRDAPIGTQVTWTNQDAYMRCGKDPTLPFCSFASENATKIGPDQYSAYPFEGAQTEARIIEAMAAAPFDDPAKVPRGYAQRNIYVSMIRYPKP
jgi:hypothetical protein